MHVCIRIDVKLEYICEINVVINKRPYYRVIIPVYYEL